MGLSNVTPLYRELIESAGVALEVSLLTGVNCGLFPSLPPGTCAGEQMPPTTFPSGFVYESDVVYDTGSAGRTWVRNDHQSRVRLYEMDVGGKFSTYRRVVDLACV